MGSANKTISNDEKHRYSRAEAIVKIREKQNLIIHRVAEEKKSERRNIFAKMRDAVAVP